MNNTNSDLTANEVLNSIEMYMTKIEQLKETKTAVTKQAMEQQAEIEQLEADIIKLHAKQFKDLAEISLKWEQQNQKLREAIKKLKDLKFDSDIEYILGRPNFQVARIAKRLIEKKLYKEREENKAEAEQAIALHFMLILYLKYGGKWQDELQKALGGKDE